MGKYAIKRINKEKQTGIKTKKKHEFCIRGKRREKIKTIKT